MLNIKVTKTTAPKDKPVKDFGFGKIFTDHMFMMDYEVGKGWNSPRIVPYGPLLLEPSTMVFHYAQEVFEGLKAYKTDDGRVLLFRPYENARRMNRSNDRLCIPQIDEDDWVQAVRELVAVDKDWIPTEKDASLYIRPFIIATDPFVGVRESNTYKFIIILSPVGSYYPNGIDPVDIYVETEYVRAVKGGTGYTKCGGNYASSIKAQSIAHEKGFTQVLWLDGKERKYIEEVGTMNVFFKFGDEVVTPELEGSILPGITRMSIIELLKEQGVPVSERRISLDELMEAGRNGRITEAFGTGTAAVISPIGRLCARDDDITINGGEIGPLSKKLYDTLTGIQWGRLPDTHGWTVEVK